MNSVNFKILCLKKKLQALNLLIVCNKQKFLIAPDTMKTDYKQILETYIRKVDRLVHLIISGEEIITTVDHPFYVQGRGFIEVESLLVGDELVSSIGEDLLIKNNNIEVTEEVVDNKFDIAMQEAGIPAEDVRGTLKKY